MSVAVRLSHLSGLALMMLMGLALLAAQTHAVDRPADAGNTVAAGKRFESTPEPTVSIERPMDAVDVDLSFRHNGE